MDLMDTQQGARAGIVGQVNVGRKYKSRKERPCDACRKRKICCTRDAHEKACSLCRTRGESCEYVLPPNVRRNRQTAPSAAATHGTSPTSSSSQSPAPPRPAMPAPRSSTNSSSNVQFQKSEAEWICQVVGQSGDQDPYVLRHCSFNNINCYKTRDWGVLRVKGDDDAPLHFTVVPDSHLDARPNYFPQTDTEALAAPYGEDLLRTYFDVIHVSYPLLEPERFTSKPRSDNLLQAAMDNLAAPFCQDSLPFSQSLVDFIQQALPIERQHPRLETLEASLLHLHRPPLTQHSTVLPALNPDVGSLVGLTHDLGLNLNPSTWNFSPSDCNRRIRIWWGVYIADKWTALSSGRPSLLNAENSNVPLPTINNFSHQGLGNESLGLGPALQFIAMTHLTTILADILTTFYTLKSAEILASFPVSSLFGLLDNFQTRLHVWHETHLVPLYNLPPLSPRAGVGGGSVLDSTGTTLLSFYTVQTVLYRAVLRILDMNHPSYADVRAQAKTVLVSVVSFVEKLGVGRLRAFWWCPQSRTSFSLLGSFMFHLLLTSISTPDIEFWSHTISHYRSLLRMQSQTWEVTRLAVVRMDLLANGIGMGNGEESGYRESDSGMVDQHHDGGGEIGVGDVFAGKMELTPGSADAWIAREGNEEMLTY